MKVNWNKYRMVMEPVAKEDGGGFRAYHPTLGFSVYGVGDTKSETIKSLLASREHYEEFIESIPNYVVPPPSAEDFNRPCGDCSSDDDLTDTAYAA